MTFSIRLLYIFCQNYFQVQYIFTAILNNIFFLYNYIFLLSFLGCRYVFCIFLTSSVQSLNCVRLFATPWIAARQASLSITISQSSLKLTTIESVMPSSHLILCRPLSCPQSLPASESFPMIELNIFPLKTL